MNDKLIITFDKSAEDIPVLVVAKEGFSWSLQPSMNIINMITGDNAVALYEQLTHKMVEPQESEEV